MLQSAARIALLTFAVFFLLPGAVSRAWIDTGHKIIADLAWDEMTPAARAKAAELLKHHPRYEKDLLVGWTGAAGDAGAAQHAFAVAATWPDLVRMQGHPMHFVAHHPSWHYIDIPYCIGGQQPPTTQPGAASDASAGPRNVVEALAENVHDLENPSLSDADKSIALCWVLHLVGDIHQPLHACTLFSPQFPGGDKGGNSFLIERDPPYANSQMNLHLLWDKMLGDYKSDEFIGYVASGLRADPSLSRHRFQSELARKDFAAWAQESHDLAVKHVYLNGTLQGAVAVRGRHAPGVVTPGLPPDYLPHAEAVAARQAVLAGYRTADLLNPIFDPTSNPTSAPAK